MASDPKVTEHELTPQGRIYKTAADTDENLADIGPDFRGTGAKPQQKEDDTKSWISSGHTTEGVDPQNRDSSESSRPQGDTMAQEIYKSLGPFQSKLIDPVEDGIVAVKDHVSGGGGDGDSRGVLQQAWAKVHDIGGSFGGANVSEMAEMAEKGRNDNSMNVDGVGHKILAAGGDDVLKVLSGGASTQEDPLKANLRVTAEMLM